MSRRKKNASSPAKVRQSPAGQSPAGQSPAGKSPVGQSPAGQSRQDDSPRSDLEDSAAGYPATWIMGLLSVWLVFHFIATAVSYTGVVAPSETHTRIENLLQPYLTPTHFTADQRPLYLAHGGSLEQPHRLQTTTADPADPFLLEGEIFDNRWDTMDPPGFAGLVQSDRNARWLSTAAMLAENDQPSLVAELLLPRVRQLIQQNDKITAVRIVRLPTQLTTTAQDAQLAPYTAVISKQNDNIALVQFVEPRLSTTARGDADE